MDWALLKSRYLRDDLTVRLGGLAANLARVRSFSKYEEQGDFVRRMIEESTHFIEWTALDARSEIQPELVDLQVQLALWQLNWPLIWTDPNRRQAVAALAGKWSDRILELSGLLDAD